MALTYGLRTPYIRHVRCEAHNDFDTPQYTVNFHQPVLDYLDAKTQNLHGTPSHTPWTDECGRKHYQSTTFLNQQNAVEALKVEHKIEDRTDDLITDLQCRHRAPFDGRPIYDSSHVTKHIHPDDLVQQTEKRIHYLNQRQFENQIKNDTMKIVKRISKMELDDNDFPREIERHVRSIYMKAKQSPSYVEEKPQVETPKESVIERLSRIADAKRSSPTTEVPQRLPLYEPYRQLIDGRRKDKLFKQVSSSLHDSKKLLRKYDDSPVECDFYRCRLNDKCWVCRKVMSKNSNLNFYSSVSHYRRH